MPSGFLEGSIIALTGFRKEERERIRLQIEECGGVYSKTLNRKCFCLICCRAGTDMVKAALDPTHDFGVPVVGMEWFLKSRNEQHVLDPLSFPIPPFYNLQMTACNVNQAANRNVFQCLVKGGAKFSDTLKLSTNYLLVPTLTDVETDRTKVQAARRNNIPLVDVAWVRRSAKLGRVAPIMVVRKKEPPAPTPVPVYPTHNVMSDANQLVRQILQSRPQLTEPSAAPALRKAADIDFDGRPESFPIKSSMSYKMGSVGPDAAIMLYLTQADGWRATHEAKLQPLLDSVGGSIGQPATGIPPTHVVLFGGASNTVKLLVGYSCGAHIVRRSWLEEWLATGDMPLEAPHAHPDTKRVQDHWRDTLVRAGGSLSTGRVLAFTGMTILLITHGHPRAGDIYTILTLGGATVHRVDELPPAWDHDALGVDSPGDISDVITMASPPDSDRGPLSRCGVDAPLTSWSAVVPYLTQPAVTPSVGSRYSNYDVVFASRHSDG